MKQSYSSLALTKQIGLPKIEQKLSSDNVQTFLKRKNCLKFDEQAGGEIVEEELSDATVEDDSNVLNSGEDGDDEQTPKHNHPRNPPLTRSVGLSRLQALPKKTEAIGSYARLKRNAPINVALA